MKRDHYEELFNSPTARRAYQQIVRKLELGEQLEPAESTYLLSRLHASNELIHTDTVTGLLNGRGITKHALDAIERATQRGYVNTALVDIDLDKFKQVNDRYGHDVGDQVLEAVGHYLQNHFKLGDMVSRPNEEVDVPKDLDDTITSRPHGDEYRVLLHNVRGAELFPDVVRLEKRLQDIALGIPLTLENHDLPVVRASMGAALILPNDTLKDITRRADLAMYHAKYEGSGARFYSDSVDYAAIMVEMGARAQERTRR